MVTNELRGERVDVVPFSDDPVELIQNALAPARVREVSLDETTGTATVVVSDYQLSLAIGKEGQNARLAARLTGWRIDIKSETQLAEEAAGYGGQEWAEGEWVEDDAGEMVWKPAEGGEAISAEQWTHAAEEQSTDSPATDSPATDSPATDSPATDADQATDAPSTDADQATDAPSTDADQAVAASGAGDPVADAGAQAHAPEPVGTADVARGEVDA
jgi:N utilization substance protein A